MSGNHNVDQDGPGRDAAARGGRPPPPSWPIQGQPRRVVRSLALGPAADVRRANDYLRQWSLRVSRSRAPRVRDPLSGDAKTRFLNPEWRPIPRWSDAIAVFFASRA